MSKFILLKSEVNSDEYNNVLVDLETIVSFRGKKTKDGYFMMAFDLNSDFNWTKVFATEESFRKSLCEYLILKDMPQAEALKLSNDFIFVDDI